MTRKTPPAARRMKALVASLTAGLTDDGSPLTEDEAAFVRLAAANIMAGDLITEAMSQGEPADSAELVRLTNTAQRVMRELREERARREGNAGKGRPGAALRQYLADAAARKAAQADDEGDGAEIDYANATFPLPDIEPEVADVIAAPEPSEPAPVAPAPPPAAQPERDGILHQIVRPFRHILSPIAIRMDSRPGAEPGRQLTEIVSALQTKVPSATVRLTTPSIDTDATVADLAIEVGLSPGVRPFHLSGVAQLAKRHSWRVEGIPL
jgi:hypothetical protein